MYNNGNILYYPKDADSNGTWFIADKKGNAGVLLNGAAVKHESKLPYKHSRGLVLTRIFNEHNALNALRDMDLDGVEPFTVILFEQGSLYQCRWNGSDLAIAVKNAILPHIWSSVTLYDADMIAEREQWFTAWLHQQQSIYQQNIIHFHATAGKGNNEYGLLMNRAGALFTVSITSLVINKSAAALHYSDMIAGEQHILHIPLQQKQQAY